MHRIRIKNVLSFNLFVPLCIVDFYKYVLSLHNHIEITLVECFFPSFLRKMGLDRELFPGDVNKEFLCRLCSQVLLNPVTAGCEHIFCQSCIVRTMKSQTIKHACPTCSAKLSYKMVDTSVEFKLQLLNLVMQCSHKCGASFILAELPDHMDVCPFAPTECNFKGCNRTIKRCDVRKHQDECDFRLVECEACGHHTIYLELFTHQSRVRCLEKKLKQQIIRERKAASREINRHREKLFRDNARLDQHQRKQLVNHAKILNNRKLGRRMSREDGDSEFDFSPRDVGFITDTRIPEHPDEGRDSVEPDEEKKMDFARNVRTRLYIRLTLWFIVCSLFEINIDTLRVLCFLHMCKWYFWALFCCDLIVWRIVLCPTIFYPRIEKGSF